ncbi:hypothetical protein ACUOCP_21545, partial [Escherichia sp. R-CC3]
VYGSPVNRPVKLINWAKLGILVGSISSAVIGYSWLRVRLRPSV